MTAWLAAALAACAAALTVPVGRGWSPAADAPPSPAAAPTDWMQRGRLWWSVLAGAGVAAFVSGGWGLATGVCGACVAWWWIGKAEPSSVRRARAAAERELPSVVHLLATALESGCGVAEALRVVGDALPGATTAVLAGVPRRLALGVPPEAAWRPVIDVPELAPLGRAMVRAHRSGASVTGEVDRLADELDRRARARVEDRARSVGVKAALPLGLCLLPSFLLIGIVPLVAGLLRSLSW